jgi:hypothetical protein
VKRGEGIDACILESCNEPCNVADPDGQPPGLYRWLFGSPLAKQLEALVIDLNDYTGAPHDWFREWHAELSTIKDVPAAMRFVQRGFELHLSRDDEGAYSILDVARAEDPSFKPLLGALGQLIAQLPKDALTALRMRESFGDPTRLRAQLAQEQTRLGATVTS